jgi:DNA-binding transcriptional regulator GbsR (MarR family)
MGEGKGTAVVQNNAVAKMDNFKKWSISTYKCTRQLLSEKFGKGSRTVDEELESQVAVLKETQKKYLNILRLAKQLAQQFSAMLLTQRSLGDAFSDLGLKTPDLHDEFNYNAETQKTLARNGEVLLAALNFFTANLQTLCSKTIEDTMATVKAYDAARVEFDAYRSDHQYYAQTTPTSSAATFKAEEAKKEFEKQKARYDRIRNDLTVKLKFLEENKVNIYCHVIAVNYTRFVYFLNLTRLLILLGSFNKYVTLAIAPRSRD